MNAIHGTYFIMWILVGNPCIEVSNYLHCRWLIFNKYILTNDSSSDRWEGLRNITNYFPLLFTRGNLLLNLSNGLAFWNRMVRKAGYHKVQNLWDAQSSKTEFFNQNRSTTCFFTTTGPHVKVALLFGLFDKYFLPKKEPLIFLNALT